MRHFINQQQVAPGIAGLCFEDRCEMRDQVVLMLDTLQTLGETRVLLELLLTSCSQQPPICTD